jgi:hypothetical protein
MPIPRECVAIAKEKADLVQEKADAQADLKDLVGGAKFQKAYEIGAAQQKDSGGPSET